MNLQPTQRRAQRGLSIVELMVGVAVGLIVVAAASLLTATQLSDNRRMFVEVQLQQDLRAALEIITREMRRAGYWSSPESYVWSPTQQGLDSGQQDDMWPAAGTTTDTFFRYSRGAAGSLGYRLNGGRLQTRVPATPGAWQDLTDAQLVQITAFSVTANHALEPSQTGAAPQRMPCPKLCADGSTNCWPQVRVRQYTVSITGRAKSDPAIVRTMSSVVRPRNDQLVRYAADGSEIVPASPLAALAPGSPCPA